MSVRITGKDLTIEAVVRVARDGEEVVLDETALDRIKY